MKKLIALLALLAPAVNAAPLLCNLDPTAPCLADSGDELFSVSDIDGLDDDITSFILGRSAGFSNAFGIYDPLNPLTTLELNDGADAPGFQSGVVLEYDVTTTTYTIAGGGGSLALSNPEFGVYISNQTGTYYSQSALNGGLNHMLSFLTEGQGGSTNGFDIVFAFEDFPGLGDADYNDMLIGCIDCVRAAVPSPSPFALLSIGALLLAGRRLAA